MAVLISEVFGSKLVLAASAEGSHAYNDWVTDPIMGLLFIVAHCLRQAYSG